VELTEGVILCNGLVQGLHHGLGGLQIGKLVFGLEFGAGRGFVDVETLVYFLLELLRHRLVEAAVQSLDPLLVTLEIFDSILDFNDFVLVRLGLRPQVSQVIFQV